MSSLIDKYFSTVSRTETIKYTGYVKAVKGTLIESEGPRSVIGEICYIKVPSKKERVMAEVVGLKDSIVQLMAYGDTQGIEIGLEVIASGKILEVPVGNDLLGRVLDGTGKPIDGKGEINPEKFYPVMAPAPDPIERKENDTRIQTGVRAIDSLLTIASGQRMGIFAGSGVGKSTIVSMIARNTSADINVIALVGERGREVNDFLRRDLGEEGLARSVVVVATGEQPAIARVRASFVATAIAEYFRDQGKNVMLMFDNISRFAKAQTDIALATGEPPGISGYPASVIELLPKLLERSGNNGKGSITAFYAVLVDADNMNEPIADAVRGIVDGHIVLSRALAASQHYPAIDVQQSISRLGRRVTGKVTNKAVSKIKRWIALYASQEDMILAGVYQKGNSAEIDEAIDHHQSIEEFLCQEEYEKCSMKDTLDRLSSLTGIKIPEGEYSDRPQYAEESENESDTLAESEN